MMSSARRAANRSVSFAGAGDGIVVSGKIWPEARTHQRGVPLGGGTSLIIWGVSRLRQVELYSGKGEFQKSKRAHAKQGTFGAPGWFILLGNTASQPDRAEGTAMSR